LRYTGKMKKRRTVTKTEWLQMLADISRRTAEREPEGGALRELFSHQAVRLEGEIKELQLLGNLPDFEAIRPEQGRKNGRKSHR
jgi:hypothetical protein